MSASAAVVVSHPHGNANVRQAALAFAEAGLLREFWTGVAWNPDWRFARFAPARLRRQLERRTVPPEVRPYLRLHPWREALRLALPQRHLPRELAPALSPNACHEDLDRRVSRAIARDAGAGIRVVYAYDHGALSSFQSAARHGVRRVYDLPIGYWRALEQTIREERDAWPGWDAIAPALDFRTPTFARKDRELELADRIVVPSRFVARTLAEHGRFAADVSVVPFGAPAPVALGERELDRPRGARLRLLYVGSLDLRKGIPYLLHAWAALRGIADLTIVGRGGDQCPPLLRALDGVRRIDSLPHAKILRLMRDSDVFLFPTLFEGMALVVPEAMSQGCAVVTTANSGAEDVIRDGENGYLVPARSVEAIVARVVSLHEDRDRLRRVREAAQATCAELTWPRYRAQLRSVVSECLGAAA